MNDYERIASVIRYLDQHHADQPDLSSLAAHVGLSPFHFHRMFSAWAGVTPKDFLQCLTIEHAKVLLRGGENVLSASLETGLSGPGRLHDLCVNLEAATPGEIRSGGQGWVIRFGFADTLFGKALIAESWRGICYVAFVEPGNEEQELDHLETNWPNAKLQRDDESIRKIANLIFEPNDQKKHSPLRAVIKGTAFQVRVWRALLEILPGALTSYGELAKSIDKPKAARAVGAAVGQNSLAYLIPCHRVIRETGVIGGYRWGTVRKRAMLAWESSKRELSESNQLERPVSRGSQKNRAA